VVGVLSALFANGEVGVDQVEAAIKRYGIDSETIDPYLV
jgi:hypothetical protein